jgi:hypothetical protein
MSSSAEVNRRTLALVTDTGIASLHEWLLFLGGDDERET